MLNLKGCAYLDQCIRVHGFRPDGLELHENYQGLRIKRMETRAILRHFGYNVSHCESLESTMLIKCRAAVVQIYGAAIAAGQKSDADIILRGN